MSSSEDRFTRMMNLSGDTPDRNGIRRGKSRVLTTLPHCEFCCGEGWVVVDTGISAEHLEEVHSIWAERERQFVATKRRRVTLREALSIRKEQVYGEQFAPCPFCEAGFVNEFAANDAGGKEVVPNWGRNGYWQGKSPLIAKACSHGADVVPLDQVIAGMRQMAGIIAKPIEH